MKRSVVDRFWAWHVTFLFQRREAWKTNRLRNGWRNRFGLWQKQLPTLPSEVASADRSPFEAMQMLCSVLHGTEYCTIFVQRTNCELRKQRGFKRHTMTKCVISWYLMILVFLIWFDVSFSIFSCFCFKTFYWPGDGSLQLLRDGRVIGTEQHLFSKEAKNTAPGTFVNGSWALEEKTWKNTS